MYVWEEIDKLLSLSSRQIEIIISKGMEKLHSATYELNVTDIYRNILALEENKYYFLISIKSFTYLDIKTASTGEIRDFVQAKFSLIIIQ